MSGGAKFCLMVILVAVVASGWWLFDGSTTRPRVLRSRLTLVVETPEGERSGSGVSEVTTSFPGGMTKALGYAIRGELVGEAVVVDLGPRGLLFAPFETQRSLAQGGMAMYNASLAPFPQEKFRGETGKGIWAKDEYAAYLDEVSRRKPIGELPFEDLQVLVRFRDPIDPTSVELVNPLDLAASFGPGVTLKRAFIEITDDPITKGIETRLPWLASSNVSPSLFPPRDPRLGRRTMSEVMLVEHLRYDDFRKLPR